MEFFFKFTEVDKKLLVKYPPAALDGQLTILLKDVVFFDEEVVSLLELAIYIASWLNEVDANQSIDFDYSSAQYQDNPVLRLTRFDNQYFVITSSWVETPVNNVLSLGEIISCFNSFLQKLDAAVQQSYGVAFSDMTFLNQLYKK